MAETVHISIPQLPALTKLLRGNDLFVGPWREALTTMGQLTEQVAISRAPLGKTGSLIAKMSYKVSKRELPMYVVVRTNARNPKNKYLYPRRIEFDRRNRRAGWFKASFNAAKGTWERILDHAVTEIGHLWSRGF